jgi:hypothetical protein
MKQYVETGRYDAEEEPEIAEYMRLGKRCDEPLNPKPVVSNSNNEEQKVA